MGWDGVQRDATGVGGFRRYDAGILNGLGLDWTGLGISAPQWIRGTSVGQGKGRGADEWLRGGWKVG